MSFTDSRASLFALVILAGACAPKSSAEASVEPDGSAVANANSSTADSETEVVGTVAVTDRPLSRSGILLHPEILDACRIQGVSTYFDFDSQQLDDQGHTVLADVASCVNEGALKGRDIIIVGYTDPRGTDEYNKELGTDRASSVAKFLQDKGVARTKIELESRGEAQASTDPNDWPYDRRVELQVAAADTKAR